MNRLGCLCQVMLVLYYDKHVNFCKKIIANTCMFILMSEWFRKSALT